MRFAVIVAAGGLCLSTPAAAQKVDLLCDGRFSAFTSATAPRDVQLNGIVLRFDLAANIVEAWGGADGLTGRHRVTDRSEYLVRFTTSQGYVGAVNRWDGGFSFSHRDEARILWIVSGTCKPAKPMF